MILAVVFQISPPTERVNNNLAYTVCVLPAGCVSPAVTEPLLAGVAVDHTGWIMNTTVTKTEGGQH